MLINLTQPPTARTLAFLKLSLGPNDEIMVSDSASYLALYDSPLASKAYIRLSDSKKIGSAVHSSWSIIDDEQWLMLICKHEKTVTW